MGLFKSKEERAAEREKREEENRLLAQRVKDSPMTKSLQMFLLDQFGDTNSEEVEKLRELSRSGSRAGYIMQVRYDGVLFNLINRKGESLSKWAISFDSLGYENLPSAGVNALQGALLETLSSIPHLMVSDTGFFMYNQNRAKQEW